MPSTSDTVHLLTGLRHLLAEGDALDRCNVCRLAGATGLLGLTGDLAARLRDEDIDVCIDAAEALGRLGEAAAVPPLLESLRHDPDGEVRGAAAEALGRIGGEAAIDALIEALANADEGDDWDDEDGWDSHWDVLRHAVQALGRLRAGRAVPQLARLLDAEDTPIDEADLALALARIGDEGEAVLLRRLTEGTSRERRRAAHALGEARGLDSARALGRALQDGDPAVRVAAADALARRGETRYAGALQLLLRDACTEVREAALAALRQLAGEERLDADVLLPLLGDPEPRLRAAALQALTDGPLGGGLLKRLRPLLDDPSPSVVAAAIPCLAGLPGFEAKFRQLLTAGRHTVVVRLQAATALGRHAPGDADTLAELSAAIADPDSRVRWAALQALMALHQAEQPAPEKKDETAACGEAGGQLPQPLDIVLATLRHGTAEARGTADGRMPEMAAATADEAPGPEPAQASAPRSTLEAITLGNDVQDRPPGDTTDPVGGELAGHQGPAARRPPRDEATQTAVASHLLAARALGGCATPAAVAALAEALREGDPVLQREAADALARMRPDAPGLRELRGPLASLLHLGDEPLRIACARALGAIGRRGQLPALREALDDDRPLVRHQAVLAIADILANQAKAPDGTDQHALAACLDDPEPGVRQAAAHALARLAARLDDETRQAAAGRLVEAAFRDHGQQAHDMGHALAALEPNAARERLRQRLAVAGDSMQRRVVLEMLEAVLA